MATGLESLLLGEVNWSRVAGWFGGMVIPVFVWVAFGLRVRSLLRRRRTAGTLSAWLWLEIVAGLLLCAWLVYYVVAG